VCDAAESDRLRAESRGEFGVEYQCHGVVVRFARGGHHREVTRKNRVAEGPAARPHVKTTVADRTIGDG
jgi:hypothetical protein